MDELISLLTNVEAREGISEEELIKVMTKNIETNYNLSGYEYYEGPQEYLSSKTLGSFLNKGTERTSLPYEYKGLAIFEEIIEEKETKEDEVELLIDLTRQLYSSRNFAQSNQGSLGRSAIGDMVHFTIVKADKDNSISSGEYFKLFQRIKKRKGDYIDDFI